MGTLSFESTQHSHLVKGEEEAMPGHVKTGGPKEADPDPSPFLFVSFEIKKEDSLKPYDAKKLISPSRPSSSDSLMRTPTLSRAPRRSFLSSWPSLLMSMSLKQSLYICSCSSENPPSFWPLPILSCCLASGQGTTPMYSALI